VSPGTVAAYFVQNKARGWKKSTIKAYSQSLRAFFRYASQRHWCMPGLAGTIESPRIYSMAGLPEGPSWEQVRGLIASLNTERPGHVRDRAIILLLAVYGLRIGEVCALTLDDLDWTNEKIRVRRLKNKRIQDFPLTTEVGNAILKYLRTVRSQCSSRFVFLSLHRPHRLYTGDRSPKHVEWCSQIRKVPFKRAWRTPVPYMEKDEIDELLRAPDRASEHGQRDYALLLFLYNSGARATEAARVLIDDLTWDTTDIGSVKICGKGRKVRFCPLWTKTMAELRPLIRGRDTSDPLFLNRYGDFMTRFGVHALVTRHAETAARKVPSLKTKRISPHTIRHTTATHLLRAGVDLNTIRAWLGHILLDTTNIYAETDLALKAKALAACDPGGGHRKIKKRWRDDPSLTDFLRKL
jgi:integrase/recombinase XerD